MDRPTDDRTPSQPSERTRTGFGGGGGWIFWSAGEDFVAQIEIQKLPKCNLLKWVFNILCRRRAKNMEFYNENSIKFPISRKSYPKVLILLVLILLVVIAGPNGYWTGSMHRSMPANNSPRHNLPLLRSPPPPPPPTHGSVCLSASSMWWSI